jgi:SAM-dependent methyltransferase
LPEACIMNGMVRQWLGGLRSELLPPPQGGSPVTRAANPGWCACCRSDSEFVERGDWLREQYVCRNCGSIPRFRAVNLTLDTYFPTWERVALHESSPSNDFVRRYCQGYSCSYFFEGVPPGAEHHGVRCENIEALTFPDDTFDLFVTQDVLEHVFQPDLATREIMRVIKPGGAHVFTAPKHKGLRSTRQRARLDNGAVVHLLEEQYHGNPIGDGRALVTWDYGDDFELHLWAWCGYPTVTYIVRDRSLGIDGEYLEVFVTRKLRLPQMRPAS